MLCIFCSLEQPSSREHVFPLAVGGTITTDRVCPACNSVLGTRVDAALSDFLPIRSRRAELGLAGHGREPPSRFSILLGDQNLAGPEAKRIRTTLDKKTGKLEHYQLYHAADVVLPDGRMARQITLDARDKDKIPKVIQRERKRHGLSPLTPEELAFEVQKAVVQTVENPVVQLNIQVSFAFLRHAMMKIAYELAFRWLGESYLDDLMAGELRQAICKNDLASTDAFTGFVGWANECDAFRSWTPHKAHHLAFASVVSGRIIIAARVFDIFAVGIPVSRDAARYIRTATDTSKLRFLAIDSVTGETIETPFETELRRLASEMTKHRRLPPFPDPLSQPE